MTRTKTQYILDLIPFVILLICAIILVWTLSTSDIFYNWKHIFGLIFLSVTAIMFYVKHHLGVITLGMMLLTGYFGGLSLSPQLHMIGFGISPWGFHIPLMDGQPAIIICTIFHFIFSGKYYFGILTRKYWLAVSKNEIYSSE